MSVATFPNMSVATATEYVPTWLSVSHTEPTGPSDATPSGLDAIPEKYVDSLCEKLDSSSSSSDIDSSDFTDSDTTPSPRSEESLRSCIYKSANPPPFDALSSEFFDKSPYQVCKEPKVWVFDGLLSEAYMDYVDVRFERPGKTWERPSKFGGASLMYRTVKFRKDEPSAREVVNVLTRLANANPIETVCNYLVSDNWATNGDRYEQRVHIDHISLNFKENRWVERSKNQFDDVRGKVVPTFSFVVTFNDVGCCFFPKAGPNGLRIPAKRGRILMFQNYKEKPVVDQMAVHQGIYETEPKRIALFGLIFNDLPKDHEKPAANDDNRCILYNPIGPADKQKFAPQKPTVDFPQFCYDLNHRSGEELWQLQREWVFSIREVQAIFLLIDSFCDDDLLDDEQTVLQLSVFIAHTIKDASQSSKVMCTQCSALRDEGIRMRVRDENMDYDKYTTFFVRRCTTAHWKLERPWAFSHQEVVAMAIIRKQFCDFGGGEFAFKISLYIMHIAKEVSDTGTKCLKCGAQYNGDGTRIPTPPPPSEQEQHEHHHI